MQLSLDGMAPPECWRHPQANRELLLQGVPVAFELQRVRRRSIGLTVASEGLRVRAPRWCSLSDIDRVVLARGAWVLDKLREAERRRTHQAQAGIEWRDGGRLPVLGRELTLRLDPAHSFQGQGAAVRGDELLVALPHGCAPERLRELVRAWFLREAASCYAERVAVHAPALGVQARRVALSQAQTRWGSASSSGVIRLSWRLLHCRVELLDYVVVHELAHLREMNHGPAFWALVAQRLPGHQALRRELQTCVLPRWDV